MIFSYSLIDAFFTCPKQAHAKYVAKSVPYVETPEMATGKRVHKYIEDHINGVDPLPDWLAHLVPVIASLKIHGSGATRAELKMGVTSDLVACGFFDKSAYLRGSIDLLLASQDKALIIDWKTGKKRDKELQLLIYALFIFAVLPMVSQVTCFNYFVAEKEPVGKQFTWARSQVSEMWREVIPLIQEIEQALETGNWPEKPSGLCKGWCPVEACQHWRAKKEVRLSTAAHALEGAAPKSEFFGPI